MCNYVLVDLNCLQRFEKAIRAKTRWIDRLDSEIGRSGLFGDIDDDCSGGFTSEGTGLLFCILWTRCQEDQVAGCTQVGSIMRVGFGLG